jgi:hypothetical protein
VSHGNAKEDRTKDPRLLLKRRRSFTTPGRHKDRRARAAAPSTARVMLVQRTVIQRRDAAQCPAQHCSRFGMSHEMHHMPLLATAECHPRIANCVWQVGAIVLILILRRHATKSSCHQTYPERRVALTASWEAMVD